MMMRIHVVLSGFVPNDKEEVGVSSGDWFEGSQVSKARPGAPIGFTFAIAEGTSFVLSCETR
jgi:hypothetical protein